MYQVGGVKIVKARKRRSEYSEVSKLLKRIKESQTNTEAEGHWQRLVEIVKKKPETSEKER